MSSSSLSGQFWTTMTEDNIVHKQESNKMPFFCCEGNCQDAVCRENTPPPPTPQFSDSDTGFESANVALLKVSNAVQYDSIMLKSPFKVYLGPKCHSISFLPFYINQKMVIILVLIMLKDTGFKTFEHDFLVSCHWETSIIFLIF